MVARFTFLDFVDADTPLGPDGQKLGIQQPQSTFGVNWYLADRMRLMINYSYVMPNEQDSGTSAASIYGTRLAVYW